MKFQNPARDRADEDRGVVRTDRGSITLYKERLYRVRPRVQNKEVGVEHGPKPDRVVERLRERRALARERAHPAGGQEALGAASEVDEAKTAAEADSHAIAQPVDLVGADEAGTRPVSGEKQARQALLDGGGRDTRGDLGNLSGQDPVPEDGDFGL
jgi:hypothetical protein